MTPNRCVEWNRLGVVLIAAGQGQRLGLRPKCLLQLDGEALITRQVQMLLSLQPASIVVVLGHYADAIAPAITDLPVTSVCQTAATFQQADSVRLGLGKLPPQCEHMMVCPCDMPALTVDDYKQLLSVYFARQSHVHFVGPSVDGQPGNPVVFDADFRDALLASDSVIGSGKWRDLQREDMLNWHTSNKRYRFDIDTDTDMHAFERLYGKTLHWPDHLEPSHTD